MEESRTGVKVREVLGRGTLNGPCLTPRSPCKLVSLQKDLWSPWGTSAASPGGRVSRPGQGGHEKREASMAEGEGAGFIRMRGLPSYQAPKWVQDSSEHGEQSRAKPAPSSEPPPGPS